MKNQTPVTPAFDHSAAAAHDQAAAAPVFASAPAPPPQEVTLNILIIEGDPTHAKMVETILRSHRSACAESICSNMAEALEAVADDDFDVAVLDLDLTDSTGVDSVRTLHEAAAQLPIVVMTAGLDEACSVEVIRAGADECLIKGTPSPASIARVVDFAVERGRREQAERERRRLRESLRSMEQLLGAIGHELRTPLAGIRATAEYLISDTPGPDNTMLKAILSESIRVIDTLNNLLDAARLDTGRHPWRWSPIALGESLGDLKQSVAHLLRNKPVELVIEIHPPDLMMRGDEDAIRRLVLNLLTNAIRHTEEGQVIVSVTSEAPRAADEVTSSSPFVLIRVDDTGVGFNDVDLPGGGAFSALGSAMALPGASAGAGLGLSICHAIARAHGGEIAIRARSAGGASVLTRLRTDLNGPASPQPQEALQPRRTA